MFGECRAFAAFVACPLQNQKLLFKKIIVAGVLADSRVVIGKRGKRNGLTTRVADVLRQR